jgi:hypothetical protein
VLTTKWTEFTNSNEKVRISRFPKFSVTTGKNKSASFTEDPKEAENGKRMVSFTCAEFGKIPVFKIESELNKSTDEIKTGDSIKILAISFVISN